jgi:hypothetical protein
LTNYENHRTERGFEHAMTQKISIMSFLMAYLSIFLTAYIYGYYPNQVVAESDSAVWRLHGTKNRFLLCGASPAGGR